MLTLTLKALERDGLVVRTVHPTVPPRVDYELTAHGRTLLEPSRRWRRGRKKTARPSKKRAQSTTPARQGARARRKPANSAARMRRFVIIGQSAVASDDFLLHDFAGTSGRLDVLARCVRAGLLFSHGVRRDALVYLVLLGGPRAPRVVRFQGAVAKYVRPDERNLSVQLKKVLAYAADEDTEGFVEVRAGISIARGAIEPVLADLDGATPFVLEEGAPDVRERATADLTNAAFFHGRSPRVDPTARARLAEVGARALGVGPVSLHTEDVVTLVSNELDRREASQT